MPGHSSKDLGIWWKESISVIYWAFSAKGHGKESKHVFTMYTPLIQRFCRWLRKWNVGEAPQLSESRSQTQNAFRSQAALVQVSFLPLVHCEGRDVSFNLRQPRFARLCKGAMSVCTCVQHKIPWCSNKVRHAKDRSEYLLRKCGLFLPRSKVSMFR